MNFELMENYKKLVNVKNKSCNLSTIFVYSVGKLSEIKIKYIYVEIELMSKFNQRTFK